MSIDFLENHMIVPAFVPVADAFDSGITTEVVSLKNYSQATLVVITGAIEDAGISNLVTMSASTNATASGTAMAFRQRTQPYTTAIDTWTALTASTSAGYNAAAAFPAADVVWYFTVTADEVGSALENADFVFATIAETVNKTITAGGIWILSGPRYPQAIPETVIA